VSARERIPELALGRVDGAERAEVLLHVHGCPRCQAVLDEHNAVADLLVGLAPEAEPPSGFDRRVLDAMHGPRNRDWRTIRRRVLVVGGAAAAAAILSVAIVRIVDAGRAPERPVSAPALQSVAMVGKTGLPVGRVVVSDGRPASLVVTVDYALPDGEYGLSVKSGSGPVGTDIGTISVVEGRGTWSGSVPKAPAGSVLQMVDATGTPVCEARLPVD
jgi:hypothetical protein